MKRIALLCLLAPLTGCTPQPGQIDNDAVAAGTTCGADKLQHLVGTSINNLDRSTLPEHHRIFEANSPISLDYRPTRLNVSYDKAGTIKGVYCV